MAAGNPRHPIITDTDALIAVANTSLWSTITDTLNITTTNVCLQEVTAPRPTRAFGAP